MKLRPAILLIPITFLLLSGVIVPSNRLGSPILKRVIERESFPIERRVITSYIPHSPIIISSDAEFELQGWPGNGTESNPYLIEGYNITSDDVPIFISSTSAHFEIRDCYLNRTNWGYSIEIDHAHNGVVNGCYIDTQYDGILVDHSDNMTMVESEFHALERVLQATQLTGLTLIDCSAVYEEAYAFPLKATLSECTNCTIRNNSFQLVYLELRTCRRLTIENNVFVDGGISISFAYSDPVSSDLFNSFASNTVNGRPLMFLIHQRDLVIDADDFGQIILVNCTRVKIQDGSMADSYSIQIKNSQQCSVSDVEFTGGAGGIMMLNSTMTVVEECSFAGTHWSGIQFHDSRGTTIKNCYSRISEYGDGIWGQASPFSTIEDCNVMQPRSSGINLNGCDNSTIKGNSIGSSYYGIRAAGRNITIESNHIQYTSSYGVYPQSSAGLALAFIYNSTIVNNLIRSGDKTGVFIFGNHTRFYDNLVLMNDGIGIQLYNGSSDNILFNNTIAHNFGGNAIDNGFSNQWDDGISIGNLWSDYYGNTSTYSVPGGAGSIDRFPLPDTEPPIIEGLDDFTVLPNVGTVLLYWNISDFYPRDFIVYLNGALHDSGLIRVLAPVASTTANLLPEGVHNFTIVAYDMSGNSASDTVMVTVSWTTDNGVPGPEPPDIVIIIMIAGGLIFAIGVAYVLLRLRGNRR